MPEAADQSRAKLGHRVQQRREELGLSLSAAARQANVNRATWTGVERGDRDTEDYTYGRIEQVLGWSTGSVQRILNGGDPTFVGTRPAQQSETLTTEQIMEWAEEKIDEIWERKNLTASEKQELSAVVRTRVGELLSVVDRLRRTA